MIQCISLSGFWGTTAPAAGIPRRIRGYVKGSFHGDQMSGDKPILTPGTPKRRG